MTAQAAVAEQLRSEILSGVIPPGTRLLQSALAARMQLSTTPVREALRELATEGLLRVDPHKGVVVPELTLDDVTEMYEIRLLVEPAAVARAVRQTTTDELHDAAELLKEMEVTTEPSRWAMLNRDFHDLLIRASHRQRFVALLTNLAGLSVRYVALSLGGSSQRILEGNQQHRAILAACRRGDSRAARTLSRQHLQSTVDLLRSRL